jgi:hypothetical protein
MRPKFSDKRSVDLLHHALVEHRVRNLHKAGDVRTHQEVANNLLFGPFAATPTLIVIRR